MARARSATLVLALPLAAALGACGGAAPHSARIENVPGSAPAETTLVVRNESAYSICYVYLAHREPAVGGTETGAFVDLLGFEGTLGPRAEQSFSVQVGSHALRLEDCDTNVLFAARVVTIGPGANIVEFR
jgi:hypothetical protein